MSTAGKTLRRYTEQEMALIADRSLPASSVADELGLAESTIYHLRKRMRDGTFQTVDWVDSEIDFLVENMNRMTTSKMADFLGRDERQVKVEIDRLRRNKVVDKRSGKSLNPQVVADRPLLAKTCPKCGLLLGSESFSRNRKKSNVWMSDCRPCQSESSKKYKSDNEISTRSYSERLQSITRERAENSGKEWTSSDLELLSDPDKSAFQKAIELKRTYYSTRLALHKNGLTSQPDFVAMKDGEWKIHWDIELDEEVA